MAKKNDNKTPLSWGTKIRALNAFTSAAVAVYRYKQGNNKHAGILAATSALWAFQTYSSYKTDVSNAEAKRLHQENLDKLREIQKTFEQHKKQNPQPKGPKK
jgi:hypothetical protein